MFCSVMESEGMVGGLRSQRHGPANEFWAERAYRNPVMWPLASMSIFSAAGTFGRPGMSIMSPATATTNPAPAERRTSRTGNSDPWGAPMSLGSWLMDDWVLAMQMGSAPYPLASS